MSKLVVAVCVAIAYWGLPVCVALLCTIWLSIPASVQSQTRPKNEQDLALNKYVLIQLTKFHLQTLMRNMIAQPIECPLKLTSRIS